MLPYFAQPEIALGPVHIRAFGVLVAVGIVVGMRVLRRRVALYGLPAAEVSRFVSWILLGGFAGAHLVDRFIYFPAETLADPLSVLRFWQGLSSFGGFLGGTAAALLFFRRHAGPGRTLAYVDSFAYAFPFAWVFGRLGCFVAYDHPGSPTSFFLGQVYRDGVVRHNLGLEEALYTLLIATVIAVLGRRPRFPGFFLGFFLLVYPPFRFLVDFLRLVDVRYLRLTPGQYGCILLFVMGIAVVGRLAGSGKFP
jgi:phosphatidylglycerol:prolipoprotein diacylglycerol transferase